MLKMTDANLDTVARAIRARGTNGGGE